MTEYYISSKKFKLTQIGLMAFGGAICALLILKFIGLSKWWAFFTLLGMVVPFAAILSGNIKRLFLLFIPFILPMNADIHFLQNNLRISMSSLIIIFLYILWILELSMDKNKKVHFFPKTTIPAVTFLLITGLSLIVNGQGSFLPVHRMFEPICDFLIYFYLANTILTEKDVQYVVWVLLLGALLQSVAAITELWVGIDLDLFFSREAIPIWQQQVGITTFSRISGLMEHANMLAIYLSSIIVLLISLIFCEGRRTWKFIYWIGIGVGFFIIVYTFSRSAWFVFSIFTPLIFFIYLWKLGSIKKVVLPMIFFVVIITVGTLFLSTEIMDRLTVDLSVLSRMYMTEIGINMVKDNPFLGVGLYNYASLQFIYDTTNEGITSIFPGYLHNIYVLIAAEQGLIGFSVFLWFNYAIWSEGWSFVKSDMSFLTNVGLSFFSFILMFFLFGMANPFPRFTYIYFTLGMLVAIKKMVNVTEPIPSCCD